MKEQSEASSAWTRVAEAEGGDGLAVARGRQDDARERDCVGRAGARLELGVEQALVDVVADSDERVPVGVGQEPADAEVGGVVDGRLGAEGAALLQVLLDLRVLVVHLEADLVAAVEDARAEAAGRGGDHRAGEDDGDLVGPPERQLVADRALEPLPTRLRTVEDARVGRARADAAPAGSGSRGRGRRW